MQTPPAAALSPDLQAAIDAVYAQFAAPTPRIIEGCPCCIGSRKVDQLLATPLKALTGDMLWRYVSGAFLTVGAERDFRYLLPRILELAICDQGALPDVEIVLGKLRLAGWASWAHSDRHVIEHLLDLWFDRAFERDLRTADEHLIHSGYEDLLCGAARADLDLSRWLARLNDPDSAPIRAAIVRRLGKSLAQEAPDDRTFWADAPEGWRALRHAVCS